MIQVTEHRDEIWDEVDRREVVSRDDDCERLRIPGHAGVTAREVNDNATEVVSAIMLLITSVACRRILDLRRPAGAWMFIGPWRIWAFISLGFMFLAFDEIWSLHEKMDKAIHAILGLKETALSDRIEDLIILLYGVIGVILIYAHRSEFRSLTGLSNISSSASCCLS